MEIKEEGTSEEGQHFLPAPQANDTGDFQFTSEYACTLKLTNFFPLHYLFQYWVYDMSPIFYLRWYDSLWNG